MLEQKETKSLQIQYLNCSKGTRRTTHKMAAMAGALHNPWPLEILISKQPCFNKQLETHQVELKQKSKTKHGSQELMNACYMHTHKKL